MSGRGNPCLTYAASFGHSQAPGRLRLLPPVLERRFPSPRGHPTSASTRRNSPAYARPLPDVPHAQVTAASPVSSCVGPLKFRDEMLVPVAGVGPLVPVLPG